MLNGGAGMGLDLGYLQKGAMSAAKYLGKEIAQTHPTTVEAIKAFIESSYQAGGTLYHRYYHRLMEGFLWRYGQHHVQINPRTWLFESIPADQRIPRPMLNLVGDKTECVIGEFLKSIPRGIVLPNDTTPHNRRGARIAMAEIEIKDEEDRIDEILRLAVDIMCVCGDVYLEVINDTSNARVVEVPVQVQMPDGSMQPEVDQNGQPLMQTIRLASTRVNILSPLQVITNRTATGIDSHDGYKVFHAHGYRDFDWCRDTWKESAKDMQPAGSSTAASQFQARLQNLLLYDGTSSGMAGAPFASEGEFADDAAMVHSIRMPPDDNYPKGRYFVMAGGAVVTAGPLPGDDTNVVQLKYNPMPQSIRSYAFTRDLIPVVRHVEEMAHHIQMKRRTLGVPFVMAPERAGGQFAGGDLEMRYGGVFTYRPHPMGNLKPEVIFPSGGMTAGDSAEMDLWVNNYLEKISGIRGGMDGSRAVGVYSGVLLRQLQAAGYVRFGYKISAFQKGIERLYSVRLKLIARSPAAQFPRKGRFPGNATSPLYLEYLASDMGDNVTYRIEISSAANLDSATRINDMMELFKLGVLNPADPQLRNAALRMVGLNDLITDLSPDIQRACDENARLAVGEAVEIGPFENDAVHLDEHVKWINHPDFWMVPEDRQVATIMHAKAHHDRIQIRMLEAAASGMGPSASPGFHGTPIAPGMGGPSAPQLTPGNGIEGMPQASAAAQQAPRGGASMGDSQEEAA